MPVNITEEFVRQLMARIDFLTKQNVELTATVDSMNQTITELNQTIRELKEQLNKNSKNSFLLCCIVTAVVEYVIGLAGIYLLDMRLWDYRGLFLNIDGIICFRSIMSFAVMGMVFHYLLEPAGERMVGKIPQRILHAVCLVLLALFLTDCVFSALFRIPITY